MPVFDYTFTVDAPLQRVADFHQNTDVLKKLTPPPVILRIHRSSSMQEGMEAEFTMWFGLIPSNWRVIHINYDPLHGFTDSLQEGPFQRWEHTHRFDAEGENKSRITEHIEYEYKNGIQGLITRLAISPLSLWILFTYRKFITRMSVQE